MSCELYDPSTRTDEQGILGYFHGGGHQEATYRSYPENVFGNLQLGFLQQRIPIKHEGVSLLPLLRLLRLLLMMVRLLQVQKVVAYPQQAWAEDGEREHQ